MRNVVLTAALALSTVTFVGCTANNGLTDPEGATGASALSGAGETGDDNNGMQENANDDSSNLGTPIVTAPVPPGTPPTTPPTPPKPCVRTTTTHAGYDQLPKTITVGTATRKYLLVVPGDYDNCKKYPLVLALHGDGDTGTHFHTWMAFESASKSEAILMYPDGANNTWSLTAEPAVNADIQFLNAAIAATGKSYTLDAAKLYVTGFSSGAFMSNALACQESSMVRAIASNSGGAPFNQKQKWTATGWDKCVGQAPVATLHIHGGADTTVNTSSGRFAAQYWASVNGCATTMSATSNSACKTYDKCPAGKAVEYCEVPGMIHSEWEQTPAVAWAFFKAQQ